MDFIRLADETVDRLVALAEQYDTSVDVVVVRLLDADRHLGHTSGHRCPTCARTARPAPVDPAQGALL